MQVLQNDGRIVLAKALAAMPAHIAWGRGDGVWTNPPATPANRSALVDEICRRQVVGIAYAAPATQADYDVEIKGPIYYKRSAEPTPYLLLTVTFGFDDAAGETVRECAVFFGTVAAPGVPAGKRLLLPAEIDDPGAMYSLDWRAPVARGGTTKATEEIVIPL